MDNPEPLPDAVLVTMEGTARAYVAAYPDSGDVVRIGWDDLYSLITEVRLLRAQRVRWEALRVAAQWCADNRLYLDGTDIDGLANALAVMDALATR